jgi:hypothetical protein
MITAESADVADKDLLGTDIRGRRATNGQKATKDDAIVDHRRSPECSHPFKWSLDLAVEGRRPRLNEGGRIKSVSDLPIAARVRRESRRVQLVDPDWRREPLPSGTAVQEFLCIFQLPPQPTWSVQVPLAAEFDDILPERRP